MPIYEFHCEKCGRDFDQLFRTADVPRAVGCPRCGGKKTRRKLSLFGMKSSGGRSDGAVRRSSCGSCHASSCAGCRK